MFALKRAMDDKDKIGARAGKGGEGSSVEGEGEVVANMGGPLMPNNMVPFTGVSGVQLC